MDLLIAERRLMMRTRLAQNRGYNLVGIVLGPASS
jgi:hypothetical protein